MLDFKWKNYAARNHYINFAVHICYVAAITEYIIHVFISGKYGNRGDNYHIIPLIVTLIYPFYYEMSQVLTVGFKEYFSDYWNFND